MPEETESDNEEDSPYCPECGACGEDGCCSFIKCKQVQCAYGPVYMRDYNVIHKQWEIMFNTLKEIVASSADVKNKAETALKEVEELFSLPITDK